VETVKFPLPKGLKTQQGMLPHEGSQLHADAVVRPPEQES
jgi:hypothetical protein